MRISYVGGSEEDSAKFWLRRVGWEASEVAKKIAQEYDPDETGYVADIGGGHGREALWLAEQGFPSILIEPNKYSLKLAKKRVKTRRLDVYLINAALPYLPICSDAVDTVDFWTLHQIPDEHKLESLKEIHRIMKPHGVLYSTSFGHWEGHPLPSSTYPVLGKSAFLSLHISAGFRPRGKIEERSDSSRTFEKFWDGIFVKEKKNHRSIKF
ncbi:MAG: class I SAM-dependent methyltransferase [Candidatus Bathyarchaeota archaeon]